MVAQRRKDKRELDEADNGVLQQIIVAPVGADVGVLDCFPDKDLAPMWQNSDVSLPRAQVRKLW